MTQVGDVRGSKRAVRSAPGGWPPWPQHSARTEEFLLAALRSGRWAVSGAFTGDESWERRFAEEFARFIGTGYAVPTCNGSAALTIALEALGVGAGDEVIVPGLTWVACASAVLRVGAVPVLADIDPDTLCLAVPAVEAAITGRTRAIMAVHLHGSAVDLDALLPLAARHDIPVLEDCSHVHGARWRGRRLGSFGAVGAFSLQQTKLLTSGEGGVAVTSDEELAGRLFRKRVDGRRRRTGTPVGELELEELPGVQGYNYCMGEFAAAVAVDGLDLLDGQNAVRREATRELERLLAGVDGVRPVVRPDALTEDAAYQYCLRLDPAVFGANAKHRVAARLARELDVAVEPIDDSLDRNVLYQPLTSGWARAERRPALDPTRFDLPVARTAAADAVVLPHRVFLAGPARMASVIDALVRARDDRAGD